MAQVDHRHRLCRDCRSGAARLSRMMQIFGIQETFPDEDLRLRRMEAQKLAARKSSTGSTVVDGIS